MKKLLLSQPITELYVHKITDTIRVMEQQFTTTGEIHYTLQSKQFGEWRNVNEVKEFINISPVRDKPQKNRYEVTKLSGMRMTATVYANNEDDAEEFAEENNEMLPWENDEVDTNYTATLIK